MALKDGNYAALCVIEKVREKLEGKWGFLSNGLPIHF